MAAIVKVLPHISSSKTTFIREIPNDTVFTATRVVRYSSLQAQVFYKEDRGVVCLSDPGVMWLTKNYKIDSHGLELSEQTVEGYAPVRLVQTIVEEV